MRVAGFGFRRDADVAALRDALEAAGGCHGLSALATIAEKATAASLVSLAGELGLPITAVPVGDLAGVATVTQSDRIEAQFGVGSLAEAVALRAVGRHARIVSPRVVSQDRAATAAIAEGDGQ